MHELVLHISGMITERKYYMLIRPKSSVGTQLQQHCSTLDATLWTVTQHRQRKGLVYCLPNILLFGTVSIQTVFQV